MRKKPAHTPICRGVIDTLKKDGHARNLSDKEIADGRNFLDRVSRSAINGMAVVTSKKRPEDPISSLLYRKWFLDGKELKQRREEFPRWKDEKGRKLNLLLNVSVGLFFCGWPRVAWTYPDCARGPSRFPPTWPPTPRPTHFPINW